MSRQVSGQVSRLTQRFPGTLHVLAAATLAAVALAGCGQNEEDGLRQWMSQTRAAKAPPPEALPDVKPYFAEIPVNLKVTGRYHDVALFNADVAALSRIVSMRNLNMSVAKDGTLSMEAVAMAYRALDPDEQAAQRKAAADAAAKSKKGGAK